MCIRDSLILLKIQSLKLRILPSLKVMKVMQRRYWNLSLIHICKADIPEHTQYDTQSLAKFAFSMFWRAMRFAEEQQVPILPGWKRPAR